MSREGYYDGAGCYSRNEEQSGDGLQGDTLRRVQSVRVKHGRES